MLSTAPHSRTTKRWVIQGRLGGREGVGRGVASWVAPSVVEPIHSHPSTCHGRQIRDKLASALSLQATLKEKRAELTATSQGLFDLEIVMTTDEGVLGRGTDQTEPTRPSSSPRRSLSDRLPPPEENHEAAVADNKAELKSANASVKWWQEVKTATEEGADLRGAEVYEESSEMRSARLDIKVRRKELNRKSKLLEHTKVLLDYYVVSWAGGGGGGAAGG